MVCAVRDSVSNDTVALPLAQIMRLTAQHVQAVLAGRSLSVCLEQTPPESRGAVQAHDFYVLRQLGWAQEVCALVVPKRPKKPLLYAHLLHALVLLEAALRWGQGDAPSRQPGVPVYAPHTVVDQAVRAAGPLGLRFHKRFRSEERRVGKGMRDRRWGDE